MPLSGCKVPVAGGAGCQCGGYDATSTPTRKCGQLQLALRAGQPQCHCEREAPLQSRGKNHRPGLPWLTWGSRLGDADAAHSAPKTTSLLRTSHLSLPDWAVVTLHLLSRLSLPTSDVVTLHRRMNLQASEGVSLNGGLGVGGRIFDNDTHLRRACVRRRPR